MCMPARLICHTNFGKQIEAGAPKGEEGAPANEVARFHFIGWL